jgi:cellulose synthase/poly-beta-1,6-N-acetylglucosamine synthase-like glycosyltransferase
MAPSTNHPVDNSQLWLWLALGLIFALFVGTCAGILAWLSGQGVAAAVLTGGASFGATVTLVVLVIGLMRQRQ